MTSKGDIGSTLVRLAVLSTADPDSVPDHVRVCGEAKSVNEIAKIIGEESGETIKVESVDPVQFKESINAETSDPAQFLRCVAPVESSLETLMLIKPTVTDTSMGQVKSTFRRRTTTNWSIRVRPFGSGRP